MIKFLHLQSIKGMTILEQGLNKLEFYQGSNHLDASGHKPVSNQAEKKLLGKNHPSTHRTFENQLMKELVLPGDVH